MRTKVWLGCEEVVGLHERADQIASELDKECNPDDLIAIDAADPLTFLTVYTGVCRTGRPRVVLGRRNISPQTAASAGASVLIQADPDNQRLIRLGKSTNLPNFPRGIAVLCQTSGSTGEPKFVAWSGQGIEYQCTATAEALGYAAQERLLVSVPLTSAYGLSIVHIWQKGNVGIVLPTNTKPAALSAQCKATAATSLDGPPQLYRVLASWLEANHERRALWQTTRMWCCGGDVLSPVIRDQWLRVMNAPILDGYGLSEAGPNVALNTLSSHRVGTVGMPLLGTSIKIDMHGEICVWSPSLMLGYWPPSIESPLTEDGYLRTGDLGQLDPDGFLCVRGRLRNVIVVNGTTICPEEVELCLNVHPAVLRSAVIGFQDTHKERLVAVVETNAWSASESEIRVHCRERLPTALIPWRIVPVETMPTLPNGKVDRRSVVALANAALR